MEQRLKNLEDLSELLTKQMVNQSKSMIDVNKNLLGEIKSLREAYVKQNDDFEEFKNLLKKIYELNKQQGMYQQPPFMHPGQQAQHAPHPFTSQSSQASSQQMPPSVSMNNMMNNSYMAEQVNQSMLNNLSFQSERTPLHMNHAQQSFSVPSSASAMMNMAQSGQQTITPYLNNHLPPAQQQLVAAQKTAAFQQQQKQPIPAQFNIPGANQLNFKPTPPQQQPQPGFFSQPPPQIQQNQLPAQHPQQQAQQPQVGGKPFSFANLNKPPQNGTDANKLEQRSMFNVPPPANQATSTPQTSQLFQTSKIQSAQDSSKEKPPTFQFSPTKPAPAPASSFSPAKPATAPATSIFGSNLFKVTTPEKKAPLFGSPAASATMTSQPLFKQPEEEGDEAGASGNPEEFEPQVDFKPIVKLHEVETKTGEEDEDVLFKKRCKLFRFDLGTKEWKEKGLGDIKFLMHKETGVIRILMRREQILKLCANHRVNASMTLKEVSPKQYSWMATDFSENEAKSELLLAKFKLVEEATEFKVQFEKAVEASKSTGGKPQGQPVAATASTGSNKLSELLKSDKWNCNACYAPNKKEDLMCACCSTLKPGATAADVAAKAPAGGASTQISFGAKPNSQSPAKSLFSFGTQPPATSSTATEAKPAPFSFGQQGTKPSPSKDAGNSLFAAKDLPSFGSLASAAAPTKSLFGNLGSGTTNAFSGGLQANQAVKPLFGGFQAPAIGSPAKQTPAGGDEDEGAGAENPEDYEPQVDFKPIVKLQEVETKTGEENEIVVFKARSKLYRFDNTTKEWKEKGTGEMKVLRNKEHNNMHRILMRRDQVLKLCANHRITQELKFEIYNEKQVRWHAEDYTEGVGKHEMLAARFKHEEEAKQFLKACEDALEILKSEPQTAKPAEEKPTATPAATASCAGLKSSLSEMFKSDGWKCDACYAPNKADVVKCACCQNLKPGATEPAPTAQEKNLPAAFGQISFGSNTAKKDAAPIVFGSASAATTDDKAPKFNFSGNTLFGAPAKATTGGLFGKTEPSSIFGAKTEVATFANLAQTAPAAGFGGGFGSLGNQAKPLFGAAFSAPTATGNEGGDEDAAGGENPEEYVPQVDFKPLVKLQEVETRTGEEDEDVLFKQRCKLYRFNNDLKEWKEKGVGDIKILRHKHKESTYRILMRREQVLKLCANHRINTTIKLERLNEKQLTWCAQECGDDGQMHPEILLAKFRHEEDATKFLVEFEKVQKLLANGPGTPVKAASTKPTEDNDVVIISTVEATKEQVEKARQFQLPDNFYLYEKCQDCKGCRGCEKN